MRFRRTTQPVEEFPDEHFELPANHVVPHPASERSLRMFVIVVSIIVVICCAAVVLVSVLLRDLVHKGNNAAQLRDEQHTQTEAQIRDQQSKINKLTQDLQATQAKDGNAICTLVIGIIKQDETTGPLPSATIDLVAPFLTQYNCKVPAGLFG